MFLKGVEYCPLNVLRLTLKMHFALKFMYYSVTQEPFPQTLSQY